MIAAVADTHAVIWYLYQDPRLSLTAKKMFEKTAAAGDSIAFSAITLAEIVYLTERGRIGKEAFQRLGKAVGEELSVLIEIPFNRAVAEAMDEVPWNEVPDLPDRIIAATATMLRVPLISRDRVIRASKVKTVW